MPRSTRESVRSQAHAPRQPVRLYRLQPPPKQKAVAKKAETATSPSPSPAKFSLSDLFKPKSSAVASPAAISRATAKSTNAEATTNAPAPGGGDGLVWVNTDSHVHDREGSRFYGTSKKSKYMTEAEAMKEGNRAAGKGQ